MDETDRRRLEQIKSLYETLIRVMKDKNHDLLPSAEKTYSENSINFIENYEYARISEQLTVQTLPIRNIYGTIRPYRGLAEIASYPATVGPEITDLVDRMEKLGTEGTLSHRAQ